MKHTDCLEIDTTTETILKAEQLNRTASNMQQTSCSGNTGEEEYENWNWAIGYLQRRSFSLLKEARKHVEKVKALHNTRR